MTLGQHDTIRDLLVRAGISGVDAARADGLIARSLASGFGPEPEITLLAGEKVEGEQRRLERLTVRTQGQLQLLVEHHARGLRLSRQEIAPDMSPIGVRGRAGGSLYWSLRAAGVMPELAVEFLDVLARHIPLGHVDPNDEFELVIANPLKPRERPPGILYVGLRKAEGRVIRLVRWETGDNVAWIDPDAGERLPQFVQPVSGRVSSHFGGRSHPIFRLFRFHRGIDLAARAGSSVVAAADGHVLSAGARGGYGYQVRLVHDDGLETSYSHLSRIVAHPNSYVRQGQLIGYVGSTGLATGAHLHYEVHRNGKAIDPLTVGRFASPAPRVDRDAVVARFRHLMLAVAAYPAPRPRGKNWPSSETAVRIETPGTRA